MNLYIHFLRGGKGTLFDAGRIEGRRLVFEKKAGASSPSKIGPNIMLPEECLEDKLESQETS